eukprot:TRINITY_DN81_c2_g1_i1.p1 TRINITY_DN81_c2_g1~~TRINITY_DN81_c2_g1_i1.p1  ORF type:complete len:556 (+),score=98.88 TRINITY_DN81_c2_g1_i1:70-1668(+)
MDSEDGPGEETGLLSGRLSASVNTFHLGRVARSYVSWSTLKSSIIVILTIAAAIVFTAVNEETPELEHLAAVSQAHSLVYPIHKKSELIEMVLAIQPIQANDTDVNVTAVVNGYINELEEWHPIQNWTQTLPPSIDFQVRKTFDLGNVDDYEKLQLVVSTDHEYPLGMTLTVNWLWWLARYEVIYASIVLVILYVLIIFELVHRTIAAMFAAFLGLGLVSQMHARPSFEMVVSFIDYETVGLLFGMMIMVGIFSTTGVFEWGAVRVYKLSKGNLWTMTIVMCIFTAVISAFLDNVTTILLFAPVTIKICKVLDVPPVKILLAEVMFSNVGGTATIIGDPPNIIIGNHPVIKASVDFATFSMHIAPNIVICLIALYFYFWKFYSDDLHRDPNMSLKTDIKIWKRTLSKFTHIDATPSEQQVAAHLKTHIVELEDELRKKSGKVATIAELERKYRIKDYPLLINSCVVLSCVMILFFLHSFLHVNLTLAWIAIIGAMIHIVVSGIRNVDEILEKVEFGTLMFFASLFILMRCLE